MGDKILVLDDHPILMNTNVYQSTQERHVSEKILIVDDDQGLLKLLQDILQAEGYQVVTASEGREGLRLMYAERPDLLILDIMMPELDGYEMCQRVRELSDIPIVMLTAKGREEDIIKGLDLGADDYVTKPFRPSELLARLRSALRRSRTEPVVMEAVTYNDDHLSIDLEARRVIANGEVVKLTGTEYKLLALLVKNKGRVLTFQQLLESVWGFEYIDEVHYLHVYICHLRRKLEPDPKNPRYLINELTMGYRFEPQR